jgi:hypothetical protein
MSTIPAIIPEKKGALLNSAAMRRYVTFVLSLLVVLSCFLSYISYPVPAYEGYDSAAAAVQAADTYQKDLQAYYDNVALRDSTEQNIDGVLQPAFDSANARLKELQSANPVDEAAVAAAQAEADTAKAALTDGRKVLTGLQNLIAPVPVQDPVPADSKLTKYADGLQTMAETRTLIEKQLQPAYDKAVLGLDKQKGAAVKDEAAILKAQAVDECVDNVTGGIDGRRVEVVYLIKSRVEHITQTQHRHQNDDWVQHGQGHIPRLLPPAGAVDDGSFVKLRIDGCDGRQVNDSAKAKSLPNV